MKANCDAGIAMRSAGYGMQDSRCKIRDKTQSKVVACLLIRTSPRPYPAFRIPYLVSLPAALLLFLLGIPSHAEAHLVNTGLGPFYDGVSHLFIAPEDLLTVLSLGMLAGLGGPRHGRVTLFSLTGAWMVGGLAGLTQTSEISFPLAAMISFLVTGALVALDRKLPIGVNVGFATLFGLLHGFLNGSAIVQSNLGLLGLIGIGAGVFVLAACVAAFVVWLQPAWTRIGIRVAGSWIVAVGLLMVGWTVRGK
jgi:hydrogenase/urease accessory protein HupE